MVTGRAMRCNSGKSTCLEGGEAVRDGLEALAHGVEMIQPLAQPEIAQVVGAQFIADKAGEFLVLFQERILPVRSEHVMSMLDLVDDDRQFPTEPLVQAHTEDLADSVRRQAPEADLAAALEDLVNGEVTPENEVAEVFHLCDGVEARQIHLAALAL